MPSYWNFEALKAQAIAARSYALFHMSRSDSQSYDLTNTQRHQVYSGVSGETEAAYAAVTETTGLVAVGQDAGIVQTMYASTDHVVAEAHQGAFSMSQTGAALKADQGWNFAEILAYYYPNTALAVLSVATQQS
jgi:SpoIID/LytB domain protein